MDHGQKRVINYCRSCTESKRSERICNCKLVNSCQPHEPPTSSQDLSKTEQVKEINETVSEGFKTNQHLFKTGDSTCTFLWPPFSKAPPEAPRLCQAAELRQYGRQVARRRQRVVVLSAQLPLPGLQEAAPQRLGLHEGTAGLQHMGQPERRGAKFNCSKRNFHFIFNFNRELANNINILNTCYISLQCSKSFPNFEFPEVSEKVQTAAL